MSWIRKLIQFLRSFLSGKPEGGFPKSKRDIYSYFDGTREVRADPLLIHVALMKVWGELCGDLKIAYSQITSSKLLSEENKLAARIDAAEKVRGVFRLKALDQEGGLTIEECLVLLDDYLTWADNLKKDTPPSPTSPGETSVSTGPSSDAAPATPTGSDSGSTASESKPAVPGVPIMESPSLWANSDLGMTGGMPTPTALENPPSPEPCSTSEPKPEMSER